MVSGLDAMKGSLWASEELLYLFKTSAITREVSLSINADKSEC